MEFSILVLFIFWIQIWEIQAPGGMVLDSFWNIQHRAAELSCFCNLEDCTLGFEMMDGS